jgi:uncharacterized Tic20 family protein
MQQKDERNWGLAMHLAGLAGMFILPAAGNIIGVLILWLVKRSESEFLDNQGKEALNFQITISIINVAINVVAALSAWHLSWESMFYRGHWNFREVTLFSGVRSIIWIINIIFSVMGAVKASNGIHFRYPLCWRLVK